MNAKEKVPLGQGTWFSFFVSGAGILAALHQHPAPPVRGLVEENAEVRAVRCGILVTSRQSEIGIKGEDFGSV